MDTTTIPRPPSPTPTRPHSTTPTRPPDPAPPVRIRRDRVAGLDLARFLAVVGMIAVHLLPAAAGDTGPPYLALSGKPAALFAVLAGVGIALSTRSALRAGDPGAARRALIARGAVLLVLGLTLGQASAVLVILAYYGLTFWLAAALITLRDRTLVVLAVVWALVWPVLAYLLQGVLLDRQVMASPSWTSLADPLALAQDLLLTGTYPAFTWIVYVIVGLVVGRAVLRADGVPERLSDLGLRLAAYGAALATIGAGAAVLLLRGPFGAAAALERAYPELPASEIAGWLSGADAGALTGRSLWHLAGVTAHSGTTPDLVLTTGAALLALGGCLAFGAVLGERARRVLGPVTGAGSAPLTVYVLHAVLMTAGMIALAVMSGRLGGGKGPAEGEELTGAQWATGLGAFAVQLAIVLALGAYLARSGRRGPLETVVGAVARRSAGR